MATVRGGRRIQITLTPWMRLYHFGQASGNYDNGYVYPYEMMQLLLSRAYYRFPSVQGKPSLSVYSDNDRYIRLEKALPDTTVEHLWRSYFMERASENAYVAWWEQQKTNALKIYYSDRHEAYPRGRLWTNADVRHHGIKEITDPADVQPPQPRGD